MKLRTPGLFAFSLACAIALSGCTTNSGSSGTRGLLHLGGQSSPSAPYITALQGGIVGRSGVELSANDRQRALEAEYRALEGARSGQAITWQGSGGVSGQVVAAAPYQVGSQNCRQYTHTVTSGGKQAVARGAACRNGDGSWSPLT
ncbi:hypothetical protein [Rhizobium sp. BK251]|uniref:hypothetical protein n=1 Tax=Rhizobium sp. BK251 TaxID=2512125 RepID=UPI00104D5CE6|nr:hypothetical protein [Rhizobium sp. BK251]TCL76186.1 surface antigen [Rhizobium sp. BK251]